MKRTVAIVAGVSVLVLTGCKTPTLGPYTAPRVTGRVLAADTGQPLAGVRVQRDATERASGLDAPKGGERLKDKAPVTTGADGTFLFPSTRALTVFRPVGWNWVRLDFDRSGYQPLHTNYSILTPATNAPSGEPMLHTGDIRLKPVH